MAFDAANHRPGYRYATDAALEDARVRASDAYFEMVARAERAWRAPFQRDANQGGGLTCPRCHGEGRDPTKGGVCKRCDGEGFIEDYPEGYEHEPKDEPQPDNSSNTARMRAYLQGAPGRRCGAPPSRRRRWTSARMPTSSMSGELRTRGGAFGTA
jgi:hypothetical protein